MWGFSHITMRIEYRAAKLPRETFIMWYLHRWVYTQWTYIDRNCVDYNGGLDTDLLSVL